MDISKLASFQSKFALNRHIFLLQCVIRGAAKIIKIIAKVKATVGITVFGIHAVSNRLLFCGDFNFRAAWWIVLKRTLALIWSDTTQWDTNIACKPSTVNKEE